MVKPIETKYNNYKFRSRLEARWAVFFDEAGIQYQYEPEGFVLNDGTYYLPDFYLPWFKAYVEIKPLSISPGEEKEARRKLEKLMAAENIECVTMLFLGDPVDNNMNVYCFYYDSEGGGENWYHGRFVEGGWYYKAEDSFYGNPELDALKERVQYGYSKHFICFNCDTPYGCGKYLTFTNNKTNFCYLESAERCYSFRQDFTLAAKAAREARFEYDETKT